MDLVISVHTYKLVTCHPNQQLNTKLCQCGKLHGGGRGGILHTFCVLAIVGSVCKTVYIITFLCVGRLSCREIVDVE